MMLKTFALKYIVLQDVVTSVITTASIMFTFFQFSGLYFYY